ncbi:4-coumarate--CoA ligase-like 9 [Ricinus communis]|uniref:AMP dependent CoA ligase, putative n=1 Tax=Ricinus communis TaxID=3988 RepID=B9RMJ5_RICCO|nr:4-coumarate--CoA ligase-like 9 [Ricinus communis]EEF47518.1 AMP dependent CoA ligase, putative [Ricinus communis]|eukprot:XP_002514964.1 4-coumarate--CoA ligase-like 9 [Ricinus communis]
MSQIEKNPSSSIDPKSGFCSKTKTFYSLRSLAQLPPLASPISVTDFIFSLLQSFPPSAATPALIDAVTGHRISYPEFIILTKSLSSYLHIVLGLRKGDTAFILSPNSVHIPIICFSLLSLGVIVSPGNPASSESEIQHQIHLSKPVVAFVTGHTAHKITNLNTIVIDSHWFESIRSHREPEPVKPRIYQSDPAAILYSSGTTGRVKGVILTHRNFTYVAAAGHAVRAPRQTPPVSFCVVPYFHVYGLSYFIRTLTVGETLVSMGRFDMKMMLKAIQDFRITHMALAPPVVVAMAKGNNGMVDGYDLSSLEVVGCGGAPLRESVVQQFRKKFPNVILGQAYGLTESTARVFGTLGSEEGQVMGATGKLMSNCEAKIVHPETGTHLPPGSPGEIWVRGPSIMKGYVNDEAATAATLDSEGWLRTGDLCYIDNEGFLFFVDRIKELIKYKGYQVAPAELEHLLHSHPDIAEAAVIPYPDAEAGQVPMAFVVRQSGSTIDESQIKDFIAKQVAPYKRIRRVIFIDSLPKNAGGKVLRKDLIRFALSGATSKL